MNLKFGFLTMFMTLLLWSGCKDVNDPGENGSEQVKIEVTTQDGEGQSLVFTTSATIKLNLKGVESFVYELKDGEVTEEPDPVVMFANASDEGGSGIITAQEGENEVTVNGLDGNTKYTMVFAFKCGKEYQVESVVFTTVGYDSTVTLISVDYEGFTFHVEAGDDTYYRLGITEAENYYGMKTQFMHTDYGFLQYGTLYKGSQTITIKNGDLIDPEQPAEDWNMYNFFYPGGTYVLLFGECDAEGNMLCEQNSDGPGGGIIMSQSIEGNIAEYTEEYTDWDVTFNGKFARMKFWTKLPEVVETQPNVSILKQTEKNITFSVIPDKDAINYGAVVFSEDDYNMILDWMGDKGIQTYVFHMSQQFTGNEEVSYSNMQVGGKYKFFVITNYNEDYTKQNFYVQDFEITASTNPKSELVVEGVTDNTNPYKVIFNIKAPNKDCYGIRYLANYKEDWETAPAEDAEMLASYGQDIFDKEVIDAINSNEGYNIEFGSWENSTTIIKLLSYNVDEAPSDVIFEAEATSPEEYGTPIESDIFDKITGTWNATYTYRTSKSGEQKSVTFPIVFTQTAEAAPSTLPQDVHDALLEYWKGFGYDDTQAEQKINEYVADYKVSANKYTKKYSDMNRIVGNGFAPLHDYYGTWDLFCDMNYSAYDTDELFYDFGPKVYLQVIQNQNGEVEVGLATYQDAIPPVSSGVTYYDYYIMGDNVESSGAGYVNVTYPVELSADGNTLTIKGFEDNTVSPLPLYPSIGYQMYGYPFYKFYGDGNIVLSKVNDSEDLAAVRPSASETLSRISGSKELKSVSPVRKGNRFMRTYIPNEKTALKFGKTTVEYSPIDWSKKLEKKW